MTVAEATAPIGRMLGRVRLDAVIGEGAAGTVYRGRHTSLGTDVAVKVLKTSDRANDPAYRERFRREARLAARLDHPGLVRVIDFGEEDGHLYLVMDYVEGFSLDRFIKHKGGLVDEPAVLKILLAIAMTMRVAHANRVIHRDLKPANVLISRVGRLKVTDLGLAREEGRPGLTQERVAVGSPAYMSPEALSPGMEIDGRTDIYALGVIGYQLMFGKLPFTGTIQETIRGHLLGDVRWDNPTQCGKGCIALVRQMMAHSRDERFQSMEIVAIELRKQFEAVKRRQRKRPDRAQTVGGSGSRPTGSGSGSDFAGLGTFLESRLGTHASEIDGGQVIHTTLRERLLVWVLLGGLIGVLAAGYVYFGGE